jgi:hypothetical protein
MVGGAQSICWVLASIEIFSLIVGNQVAGGNYESGRIVDQIK